MLFILIFSLYIFAIFLSIKPLFYWTRRINILILIRMTAMQLSIYRLDPKYSLTTFRIHIATICMVLVVSISTLSMLMSWGNSIADSENSILRLFSFCLTLSTAMGYILLPMHSATLLNASVSIWRKHQADLQQTHVALGYPASESNGV